MEAGNILELPKSLLDPRRTLEHTPQPQEEGLQAYAPELPMSTLAMISYNQTLERIKRIHTAPSGLESTSLVFGLALDYLGVLFRIFSTFHTLSLFVYLIHFYFPLSVHLCLLSVLLVVYQSGLNLMDNIYCK